MTEKGKKHSEDVKITHKDNLKKLASAEQEMATLRDTYVPYFKENELYLCRCYSDLFARLRQNRSWNNVFYSLYFDRSKNWFDYDKLFKELNSLFGTYYKILRYLSGYRKARLVSFESKGKFLDWTIEWGALYQLFCLLRIINVTNYGNWKKYHTKNPLDNWQDVIFIFLTKFHESKYGLNDDLYAQALKYLDKQITEKVMRNSIERYLCSLKDMFGSNFQFGNGREILIGKGQTHAYNSLRRIHSSQKGKE